MSITSRILFGFALISALGFYFLLNPILDRVERQYLEAAEEPMVDVANILAEMAAPILVGSTSEFSSFQNPFDAARRRVITAKIYEIVKKRVEMDAYFTNAKGVVVFDSGHPERVGENYIGRLDVYKTLLGQYGARSSRADLNDPLSSIMFVAAPILDVQGRIIGVATVYKPQRSMLGFIQKTRHTLRRLGLLAATGALLAGFLLSRWVALPLRRLINYAAAVARGERVALPKLPGKALNELGHNIASMRTALDGRQYVESYVQTLTHEMKSPVAAIRGAAELLDEPMPEAQQKKFLANIRTETNRIEQLSDRLLALSSVESMDQLEHRESVELHALLNQLCDQMQASFATHQVTLSKDIAERMVVDGEPFLLEMAISNLLQNALEFTPAGCRVKITSKVSDNVIKITIDDEGPGVPDYARERIFERFYSLPRPRSGKKSSGLGLCLVREVSTLHGGTVELSSNQKGGTRATLRLRESPHSL